MASDCEDFDDLEALRQAALATVKARSKNEPTCEQLVPSEPPVEKEDGDDEDGDDEDLLALREAALRSKGRTVAVAQTNEAKDHPAVTHLKQVKKQQQQQPHKLTPYASPQKNGDWKKTTTEPRQRRNNLIVIPLETAGRAPIELAAAVAVTDLRQLLPHDKWAKVQPDSTESISTPVMDEIAPLEKRKGGKFSRFDADADDDDDSSSESNEFDSDMELFSSPVNISTNKLTDSDDSISQRTDTRIVTREKPMDIGILQKINENSDFETMDDNPELHAKDSPSIVLPDYEDEPLLDIEENGVIDESLELNKSTDKSMEENLLLEDLSIEQLDLDDTQSVGKEVLEARKRKFDSTKEITGSELTKTISLKGIIPKSRKRRKRHKSNEVSHSSTEKIEETVVLQSRDLKERNCDEEVAEPEPLLLVGHHFPREHRHRNKHKRSRSNEGRKYQCGSLSDDVSQPLRLKDRMVGRQRRAGSSTSSRFNHPMSASGENQRRVVQKETNSNWNCSKLTTRKYFSEPSDSDEGNENTLFKGHAVSDSRKQGSQDILDSSKSDYDQNPQARSLASDRGQNKNSNIRGWAHLMESRSKNRKLKDTKSLDSRLGCEDLSYREKPHKSPVMNITFNSDSTTYSQKNSVEDRLSVHQRLGLMSKTKQEAKEKLKEKKDSVKDKNNKADPSKETELDRKIRRIQEMNAAILKRQEEVLKDKEQYG